MTEKRLVQLCSGGHFCNPVSSCHLRLLPSWKHGGRYRDNTIHPSLDQSIKSSRMTLMFLDPRQSQPNSQQHGQQSQDDGLKHLHASSFSNGTDSKGEQGSSSATACGCEPNGTDVEMFGQEFGGDHLSSFQSDQIRSDQKLSGG